MTNLAFADASEEDKLKVLVNQSLYDSMRSVFHLLMLLSLAPSSKYSFFFFLFFKL